MAFSYLKQLQEQPQDQDHALEYRCLSKTYIVWISDDFSVFIQEMMFNKQWIEGQVQFTPGLKTWMPNSTTFSRMCSSATIFYIKINRNTLNLILKMLFSPKKYFNVNYLQHTTYCCFLQKSILMWTIYNIPLFKYLNCESEWLFLASTPSTTNLTS